MRRRFVGKTVVITGASSGIGRLTAQAFAREGAKLGLIARSEDGLASLAAEVRGLGGRSYVYQADVSDPEALRKAADHIARQFGGIDIWINDAATSVYAEAGETSLRDLRRVMDVNFFGQVHGVQAALPHLKRSGGQIIGILSVESEIGVPYHSAYSASKHALYGYYKSLRIELMHDHSPVRISTILPASIGTPFFEHAKTQLGVRPRPLPPVYHPQRVVDAILKVSEKPRFATVVGGAGKNAIYLQRRFPEVFFKLQSKFGFAAQKSGDPKDADEANNLYDPVPGSSRVLGKDKPTSAVDWVESHAGILLSTFGASIGALLLMRSSTRQSSEREGREARTSGRAAEALKQGFPPAAAGDEMNPEAVI